MPRLRIHQVRLVYSPSVLHRVSKPSPRSSSCPMSDFLTLKIGACYDIC